MPVFVPIVVIFGVKAAVGGYLWKRRYAAYDPSWLVDLARRQRPALVALAAALEECTRARVEGPYFVRFKRGALATDCVPGRVTLEDAGDGTIAIEIGEGGAIVGVDFVSRRERDGKA